MPPTPHEERRRGSEGRYLRGAVCHAHARLVQERGYVLPNSSQSVLSSMLFDTVDLTVLT